MWVGLQISEEKICIFGKKLVGPENDEEKKCNLWKKFVGGYRITAGTNFRHTFRKYLLDPPPCFERQSLGYEVSTDMTHSNPLFKFQ